MLMKNRYGVTAGRAPGMPGRLNAFQRMMLNWEDVRAFNAVHVAQLDRHIGSTEVETSVVQTLTSLGIRSIEFDGSRRRYAYSAAGPRPQFRVVEPSGNTADDLTSEIASQLNRPFAEGRHSPFRFFYLMAPAGCYLGVAYHHVIGDAASVGLVMQRLLQRLVSPAQPLEPIDLYPPPVSAEFSRELSWSRLPRVLGGVVSDLTGYRSCHRISFGDQRNGRVGFRIIDTQLPTAVLVDQARHLGAKVQDLVFAALFEAFAKLIPDEQRGRTRRPNLALTAAIDLRRHSGGELQDSLGQFLSSFAVKHRVPPETPFAELVRQVNRQTQQIKQRRPYFAQAALHSLSNAVWPLLPRAAKLQPLRYLCPFVGTISNMDLTRRCADLPIRDYLRAASTGPVMPMMLDITTLGETFNLTLMYRQSAFSEAEIETIGRHVRKRLVNQTKPHSRGQTRIRQDAQVNCRPQARARQDSGSRVESHESRAARTGATAKAM